jgi:hypothetical protein
MKEMSFLEADGYINVDAFVELVRDIDKLAASEGLKPAELYFTAKGVVKADHPSKQRLEASAFEKKRAQPIKKKTRMPASGSRVRMMVLLRNYKGLDQFADYWKDYNLALKAIERHNKKAEKTVATLKERAAKMRDRANAEFDKNLKAFDDLLADAGIDEKDVAIGTSMMGKSMIVRLPNGGFISIGKADKEKFDKAVASSKAAAVPAAKTAVAKKAAPGKKAPATAVAAKKTRNTINSRTARA